jgi:hypothetical protein
VEAEEFKLARLYSNIHSVVQSKYYNVAGLYILSPYAFFDAKSY